MKPVVIDGCSYLVPDDEVIADPSELYDPSEARVAELVAMPYAEYLLTPEWKEKRRLVINRSDYFCDHCGRQPEKFHIHHLTYERVGREFTHDLQALCPECHRKEHGK